MNTKRHKYLETKTLTKLHRAVKPIVKKIGQELEKQNSGVKLSIDSFCRITFTYQSRRHLDLFNYFKHDRTRGIYCANKNQNAIEELIKFFNFPVFTLSTATQIDTIELVDNQIVYFFGNEKQIYKPNTKTFNRVLDLKHFLSAYLRQAAYFFNNVKLISGSSYTFEQFSKLTVNQQRKRLIQFYSINDNLLFNINHVYTNPQIANYDSKIVKILQDRTVDIKKVASKLIKELRNYQFLIPMFSNQETVNMILKDFDSNRLRQLLL